MCVVGGKRPRPPERTAHSAKLRILSRRRPTRITDSALPAAEKRGAGEILLTSMDCDGTKAGYDIELTRRVAEAVGIPVIASGGAGNMQHFKDVLTDGKADAALAASLFHFGEMTISDLKNYLAFSGVAVRM